MGEQARGTATAQHAKDPIEDQSHITASGVSSCFGRGDQGFENGPFRVGEITGICCHRYNHLLTHDVSYPTYLPHFVPLPHKRLANVFPWPFRTSSRYSQPESHSKCYARLQ